MESRARFARDTPEKPLFSLVAAYRCWLGYDHPEEVDLADEGAAVHADSVSARLTSLETEVEACFEELADRDGGARRAEIRCLRELRTARGEVDELLDRVPIHAFEGDDIVAVVEALRDQGALTRGLELATDWLKSPDGASPPRMARGGSCGVYGAGVATRRPR